jgi:hypothetical protein
MWLQCREKLAKRLNERSLNILYLETAQIDTYLSSDVQATLNISLRKIWSFWTKLWRKEQNKGIQPTHTTEQTLSFS